MHLRSSPLVLALLLSTAPSQDARKLLPTETLAGSGVWVIAGLEAATPGDRGIPITVWFGEQLLGDGKAYARRSEEFRGRKRRELRAAAIRTLKAISAKAHERARPALAKLVADQAIARLERHWIVNGFSCVLRSPEALAGLKKVPGVRAIFRSRSMRVGRAPAGATFARLSGEPGNKVSSQHPWYTKYLLADRTWREFDVRGQGILNVVHDGNFALTGNHAATVYRNPKETPGNGADDDGNGLIDDYHGYNFAANSPRIEIRKGSDTRSLHGTMCAAIICGIGTEDVPYEMGIAPRSRWAGVIAGPRIEAAVQWAAEQGADTYSMSFSIPRLGDYRSHWRKVLEHGSLCGIYFVSGAGNFAREGSRNYAPVPVQMRTPEDIPAVVFAAAGVQRDLSRTPFSSQGPVEWQTHHYKDGRVQKPEVCAFNFRLPAILPDGTVHEQRISGNSFAGPMFCGAIALMLSADPDLLPWDLMEIITGTALDVGPKGIDAQTGHGLINCYRAVKEVLRRKALREGQDASRFTGRTKGDELDVESHAARAAGPVFSRD